MSIQLPMQRKHKIKIDKNVIFSYPKYTTLDIYSHKKESIYSQGNLYRKNLHRIYLIFPLP